jgi:transposase-like protein
VVQFFASILARNGSDFDQRLHVDSQKFTSTTEVMAAMKDMFRDVIQQVMESELEEELGYEKSERVSNSDDDLVSKNYRNGHSQKTVKTQLGAVNIKVPRDRNGKYEPKIIGKYNRNADGMEEKILALYACGMSQRDISEQIKSLYDVDISPELVSDPAITTAILDRIIHKSEVIHLTGDSYRLKHRQTIFGNN